MGIAKDKIRDLKEREAKILKMGGDKATAKQCEKGRLNARQRLDLLFDPGTFREIDMFVTQRCVNFGMEKVDVPSDGVITGHGLIDKRPAFAFSQDFTSRAGSLGEMHSKKICKVMDLALKAGVPCIGLNDSGGARIQEGVDALSGYGQIFYRNSLLSHPYPAPRINFLAWKDLDLTFLKSYLTKLNDLSVIFIFNSVSTKIFITLFIFSLNP